MTPAPVPVADTAAQAQVPEAVLDDLIARGRLEVRQSKRTGTTWLSKVEVGRLRSGPASFLNCRRFPACDGRALLVDVLVERHLV